jgi:hypothetical protein
MWLYIELDYWSPGRQAKVADDTMLQSRKPFEPVQAPAVNFAWFSYPNIDATDLDHSYKVRWTVGHGVVPNGRKKIAKFEVADPDSVTAALNHNCLHYGPARATVRLRIAIDISGSRLRSALEDEWIIPPKRS